MLQPWCSVQTQKVKTHANLHNVPQRAVYWKTQWTMMWDLCAKHRAGYTSHRKHFLEQSVCDCCVCEHVQGKVWKTGKKSQKMEQQESENRSYKKRQNQREENEEGQKKKMCVELCGKHDRLRRAPKDRKCDLSNVRLSDRQTHTHQTIFTDWSCVWGCVFCVCCTLRRDTAQWFLRGSCLPFVTWPGAAETIAPLGQHTQ